MSVQYIVIIFCIAFLLAAVGALVPLWRDINSIQKIAPTDFDSKIAIAELKSEFWKSLLGWISGLAVLIGFVFTWLQLNHTSRTIEISQRSQLAERFSKATTQLGEKSNFSRLGGIYALEAVALESTSYADAAVQALSAYARAVSSNSQSSNKKQTSLKTVIASEDGKPPSKDEAVAAIVAIGRISTEHKLSSPVFPRLNGIDIEDLVLHKVHLEHANFERSNLPFARITNSTLTKSRFVDATLEQAKLSCSDLGESIMIGANLRNSHLDYVTFSGSNLTNADFSGADFNGADLRGTDLRQAKGINSTRSLQNACMDSNTKLPPHLSAIELKCAETYPQDKTKACAKQ